MATLTQIRSDYREVMDRIRREHVRPLPGYSEPVFLISETYPGVWMEHVYDAIRWAELEPDMAPVARAQVRLFLDNQKEDGQLPYNVLDVSKAASAGRAPVGFSQIQECVSFARLCWEASRLNQDEALLQDAYERCARWDLWLVRNRMTRGTGLIELFCQYDSGHDNSARFAEIPGPCPERDAKKCHNLPCLPMICPDMNAVLYGSRRALAEMAEALGRSDEAAQWRQRAEEIRKTLRRLCYCPEDDFYYDVDPQGTMRKFRSIHIASLFQERVLTQAEADRIYRRHLKDERAFWTPYPFPSMAVNDPASRQDRPGNSWGFYSQGLTALRTLRWMDQYGYQEDQKELLRRWVNALSDNRARRFCQELHPLTGQASECSQWYSSAMLLFVSGCRALGIVESSDVAR